MLTDDLKYMLLEVKITDNLNSDLMSMRHTMQFPHTTDKQKHTSRSVRDRYEGPSEVRILTQIPAS